MCWGRTSRAKPAVEAQGQGVQPSLASVQDRIAEDL
jgi:hypothetical protein